MCGKKLVGSSKQCRRCTALKELGLKAGANEDSIKSAFRCLVKEAHPDRHANEKSEQVTADEKTKRIIAAYKYLAPSLKRGKEPPTGRSSRTPAPPSRNSQRAGDRQQAKASSGTSARRSRSPRQAIERYPQKEFASWKSNFDKRLVSGTKGWQGLKKWISSEEQDRAASIEFAISCGTAFGYDPEVEHYAKPKDARGEILMRLWNGSIPNVIERSNLAKSDVQFLRRLEKLKESVEAIAKTIEQRKSFLMSQDRVFPVRLHSVLEHCIHLVTSIAMVSALVRRKNMQPLKLADCCKELVFDLEENRGLSQAECHALIKCALLSHGCTEAQVAPFDTGSVERGTIRARKNAFIRDVRNSYDVITRTFQTPKQPASDSPRKKSPL